jgi:Domain of unknown function (DUF4861)
MKRIQIIVILFVLCSNLFGQAKMSRLVVIKNTLPFDRIEMVSIPLSQLGSLLKKNNPDQLMVKEGEKPLQTQLLETTGDASPDELLFQIGLKANEKKTVRVELAQVKQTVSSEIKTFSRIVPERIDDYAWENDLVAFRTYGPKAQQLTEAKEKSGTLSSGMDCWLKRVNYPIIDKWYKKHVDGGTYHKDDGEGYDPYHVGISRGCGGIGVWKNDSLYVSKNFISYKLIANGPLRTIFELTYAPWMVQAEADAVQETKRITIDLGNQLYKVEDRTIVSGTIPNITVGITLHDKKGQTHSEPSKGYFSHWEPIDDSELGTAIVANPSSIIGHKDFRTEKKDLSHLYVILKPTSTVTYFTGYGWKKAGVFNTHNDWNNYLDQFSKRLASPVVVTIK